VIPTITLSSGCRSLESYVVLSDELDEIRRGMGTTLFVYSQDRSLRL
jgi:hypothetical protein